MRETATVLDTKAIEAQRDCILGSKVFLTAHRSQAFLRFVVDRSLHDAAPKEYEIAVEVMGRGPDYDPSVDATVRVEAGRLRSRLQEYYATAGQDDPIQIDIPKGGYAAVFRLRERRVRGAPQPAMEGASASVPGPLDGNLSREIEGRRGRSRGWVWWIALCTVVVLVACFAWVGHRRATLARPIRSLAVLPLANFSGDRNQDYFAEGMTDELITELAQIPSLRVVSRTSVMRDKDSKKTLAQIARELDVDAVVEGSVVRSGDHVRITAQLIDVRDDRHLWAKSFEEPTKDVLALQDDVAREIAAEAKVALTTPGSAASGARPSPAAYDAYLRGLYFLHRREATRSRHYFEQAVAFDPSYAAAYAGLSQAVMSQNLVEGATVDEVRAPALAAARRAIELDPGNGAAYTAVGEVEMVCNFNWQAAGQDFERGVALSPNDSLSEMHYSTYLDAVGRAEDAVTHMRRALRLDPLSFFMNRHLGSTLYYARHYNEALYYLERAEEMDPEKLGVVESWVSRIYEMKGMEADAVRTDLLEFKADLPGAPIEEMRAAYKSRGWRAYQQKRIDVLRQHPKNGCDDFEVGVSYLRLGGREEGFRWLGRAAEGHCFWMHSLKVDPLMDGVRGDPRFGALLRTIGLEA